MGFRKYISGALGRGLFGRNLSVSGFFAWLLLVACLLGMPELCLAQDSDALDRDLQEQWETRDLPAQVGDQNVPLARRFVLTFGVGYLATDDYYNYIPINADLEYRFTEAWGLMLRGTLFSVHFDTELARFMRKHQDSVDVAYLGDEQLGDVSLLVTFRPVYGKWTAGTTSLGYFDWGIYAGPGVVISKTANKSRTNREKAVHPEGVFGTDLHFFFLDWLALRLDASLRFYYTPNRWMVPCTFGIGLSFFMPPIKAGD